MICVGHILTILEFLVTKYFALCFPYLFVGTIHKFTGQIRYRRYWSFLHSSLVYSFHAIQGTNYVTTFCILTTHIDKYLFNCLVELVQLCIVWYIKVVLSQFSTSSKLLPLSLRSSICRLCLLISIIDFWSSFRNRRWLSPFLRLYFVFKC